MQLDYPRKTNVLKGKLSLVKTHLKIKYPIHLD